MPADRIEVVVHPQSVVHSMVEYHDGSILAQLGQPDMRTPIAYGLGFPERIDSGVGPLDLMRLGRLDFEQPDLARFPVWRWPLPRCERGRARVALNAANEVAVEAFLSGRLAYTWIPASSRRRWSGRRGRLLLRSAVSRTLALDAAARRYAGNLGWRRPARLPCPGAIAAYRSWILDPDAFHPARLCGCARLLIIFHELGHY